MDSESERYDRFEQFVPLDEIREMYRSNALNTMLPLYNRCVQIAYKNGFHAEETPASAFVVHFFEYLRVKYSLRARPYPASFCNGYTLKGKRVSRQTFPTAIKTST